MFSERLIVRVAILFLAIVSPAAARCQSAPGAPGSVSAWTRANKEGVGTATTTDSKVWFTLEGGILTEVYYPRLDTANVRMLEFAVSNGDSVWLESKDMEHSLERLTDDALVYRQTSRDAGHNFEIKKTYVTDPQRNSLLIDVSFSGDPKYSLYVLYEPSLKNFGANDTGYTLHGALVAEKEDTASALVSSVGFSQMTSGFAGSSDGYTDLLIHRHLEWSYARAEKGNIVQSAKITGGHFTLVLGFGPTANDAIAIAKASLEQGFSAARTEYIRGWSDYAGTLRKVPEPYAREFRLAAMVLKAHEDKTYRGAMIASMSIPWGNAVPSEVPNTGGYHLVWARDLYEVATGLLAAGDRAAAELSVQHSAEAGWKLPAKLLARRASLLEPCTDG